MTRQEPLTVWVLKYIYERMLSVSGQTRIFRLNQYEVASLDDIEYRNAKPSNGENTMGSENHWVIAAVIFFARVCDVSLGTFRHAMVIRGKKAPAVGLAFVESLIWVYAVSQVLTDISSPITAMAFAFGFSGGTLAGMSIEDFFKIGDQSVRIFSCKGDGIARFLRESGYPVTVFDGRGRDGPVNELFVQAKRKHINKIIRMARCEDPACFVVVDDIRVASSGNYSVGK